MIRIYEMYFFGQYLISLTIYGAQMFQMMETKANYEHIIKTLFYLIIVFIQFIGCFCIPSQKFYEHVRIHYNTFII